MRFRPLRARLGAAVLVGVLGLSGVVGLPVAAAAQEVSDPQAEYDIEARIVAQRYDDDHVEFGMQLRVPEGPWSETALPAQRFFPLAVGVGWWLFSSPFNITADPDGPDAGAQLGVRIAAQRRSDDRIEFVFQERHAGLPWVDRKPPARRSFPLATESRRWLFSSPVGLRVTTVQEPITDPSPDERTAEGQSPGGDDEERAAVEVSDDVPDIEMTDVHTGETVDLRSIVTGETPLLFWLWNPY